jgi:hypothetical protein
MAAVDFLEGHYRYLPGVAQYSGGVRAAPGYRIERVRFADPVPLATGFQRIEEVIRSAGRPLTAFCACELRSPEPFSEAGFKAFNDLYIAALQRFGLVQDGVNPVARSNVCPELDPPKEPSFHAFAYTVEAAGAPVSFCIAGSGEAPEGQGNYRDHIVSYSDRSVEGLKAKADFVLAEMTRRMTALGVGWPETSASQVYTVFDFHPFLADTIIESGAARNGLTWHFARPPVQGIDFEMDCRGVADERVLL